MTIGEYPPIQEDEFARWKKPRRKPPQPHGNAYDGDFFHMRRELVEDLLEAEVVHPAKWQQLDVSQSPAHATHEMLNTTLWIQMPTTMHAAQEAMQPDLPWAEAHFQERVAGLPVNPGKEHANWPYHAEGADLHLKDIIDWRGRLQKGYDHNYMERFWAGSIEVERPDHYEDFAGYRFHVGDLGDVVAQLRADKSTRQAYLPVWFPEDTGATEGQRVPCTLGYHFIIRGDYLHVTYYLRSCEIYRHFTNDVYMAVRLAQWVRDMVAPATVLEVGQLTMQITSLHAFVGDVPKIREKWL